jgi:hypothetical protein
MEWDGDDQGGCGEADDGLERPPAIKKEFTKAQAQALALVKLNLKDRAS